MALLPSGSPVTVPLTVMLTLAAMLCSPIASRRDSCGVTFGYFAHDPQAEIVVARQAIAYPHPADHQAPSFRAPATTPHRGWTPPASGLPCAFGRRR